MRLDNCSITSPSRRKAIGRGSTTLAVAITIISPIKPRICQSGQGVEGEAGAIGAGDGSTPTGVREAGILIFVGVVEGNAVDVIVGVNVGVIVGQTPSGTEILPSALAHRL